MEVERAHARMAALELQRERASQAAQPPAGEREDSARRDAEALRAELRTQVPWAPSPLVEGSSLSSHLLNREGGKPDRPFGRPGNDMQLPLLPCLHLETERVRHARSSSVLARSSVAFAGISAGLSAAPQAWRRRCSARLRAAERTLFWPRIGNPSSMSDQAMLLQRELTARLQREAARAARRP